MSDSVRFHQMHLIGRGHLDKARPWPQSMFCAERHAALQTIENRLFTLPQLAHLPHQLRTFRLRGSKSAPFFEFFGYLGGESSGIVLQESIRFSSFS